jgi:hypothetical protein
MIRFADFIHDEVAFQTSFEMMAKFHRRFQAFPMKANAQMGLSVKVGTLQ